MALIAAMDPTGASAIGIALSAMIKVGSRLMDELKGNEEYHNTIWLKLDTVARLQRYVNRYWKKKNKEDKILLDIISKVKVEIEKVEKFAAPPTSWNRLWNGGMVVLGISPSVKAQLESVGTKLDDLIANIDSRRLLEVDKPEAIQQLQNLHERDLKRLKENLARELTTDNLKEVGSMTKTQYEAHVRNGVYFAKPPTDHDFPFSMKMSSSVPGCTKWILDFLRRFQDEAKLVTTDSRKLMEGCLVKLFTEVLPRELKTSLDRRCSDLTARGASLFHENIKILRSSLDNREFRKIRKDCHVQVNLWDSKWKKWEEIVRESEQIKSKKQKSQARSLKPPEQQHGQQHGQHGQKHGQQKPKK